MKNKTSNKKTCCPCGGDLLFESFGGMILYREDEKGRSIYRTKCATCGRTDETDRRPVVSKAMGARR